MRRHRAAECQIRWADRMSELSKEARRAIRDAASLAYERELTDALFYLADLFEEWKAGSRNSFDVPTPFTNFTKAMHANSSLATEAVRSLILRWQVPSPAVS